MIVIVNYDMGNIGSIGNMFRRLGVQAVISRDPAVIAKAERLIIPGVGAFDQGMENLHKFGLKKLLDERVLGDKAPVLGICLGMQLMTKSSEEGSSPGLGWIDATTVHFKKDHEGAAADMRLPHIGWNFVDAEGAHPLLSDLPEDPRFYFVHTYRVVSANPARRRAVHCGVCPRQHRRHPVPPREEPQVRYAGLHELRALAARKRRSGADVCLKLLLVSALRQRRSACIDRA
jgi:glutamine amidotransferase